MNIDKLFKTDIQSFDAIKQRNWKALKRVCKFNAKELLKDADADIKAMERVIEKRNNELTILKDFNLVLEKVKPETYWVFNFNTKEDLVKLVKSRKKQVAQFKRKITMLNHRLASVKLYADLIKRK